MASYRLGGNNNAADGTIEPCGTVTAGECQEPMRLPRHCSEQCARVFLDWHAGTTRTKTLAGSDLSVLHQLHCFAKFNLRFCWQDVAMTIRILCFRCGSGMGLLTSVRSP